jgi:hypothetical protein
MKSNMVNMSIASSVLTRYYILPLPARDDTERYQRQRSHFLRQLMDGGTSERRKGGRRMMIFDGGTAD